MLLRSLLITGAFTPLYLGGLAFWSAALQGPGAATPDPVASCTPTPTDEGEDNGEEEPRSPTGGYFS